MKLIWLVLVSMAAPAQPQRTCDATGMYEITDVNFVAAALGSRPDLETLVACGVYAYVWETASGRPSFHPGFNAWFNVQYAFSRHVSPSTDARFGLDCSSGAATYRPYRSARICAFNRVQDGIKQAGQEGYRIAAVIGALKTAQKDIGRWQDNQTVDFCRKMNADRWRTPQESSHPQQVCRETGASENRAEIIKKLNQAIGQLELQKAAVTAPAAVLGQSPHYNRSDARIYATCGGAIRAPWSGYYPSHIYYTSLADALRPERCEGQGFSAGECVLLGTLRAAETIVYQSHELCD